VKKERKYITYFGQSGLMLRYLHISEFLFFLLCSSCTIGEHKTSSSLDRILNDYWEDRMKLFPLEATANGDYRYNDQLTITISESFRDSLRRFYRRQQSLLTGVDTSALDATQKISYRIFQYEMQMSVEGLKHPTHLMPINQFWSVTIDLPQLGSGEGNQPFKSVKDHENWLSRISFLPAWTDTAIANMRKGMQQGWVLPSALVKKIIPQLQTIITDEQKSIFFGPVKKLDSFSVADRDRLRPAYSEMIRSIINPSYTKLLNFFRDEYLPQARNTSGVSALPGGTDYYTYCIRNWTTTSLTSDSIYKIGLGEVARIEREMTRVKDGTGFKGDLKAFFEFMDKDAQFHPFTTPKQVLDSFWSIKKAEDPQLARLFNHTPKSPFEIRQTEAFRAASASAEYNPPSEDGSRPGIFFVPIIDAKEFNAVGMETLFLHEAIPGHHYQISLQQENQALPKFRRFLWYGAYGEGWALYSETLGRQLGLYTNPYQYFGHLSDAMHRAIRLVVDVGLHSKGMTREEAIQYMLAHESTSLAGATAEIERYMAIPGQALSYKIGQLTISAERKKYEKQLGENFDIASFHDAVLSDGVLPLDILKEKLQTWANEKK
jgi:uncharacterized protein (DUF885 family)